MANIIQIMPSTDGRSVVTYAGTSPLERYDVVAWALVRDGDTSFVQPLVFDASPELVLANELLRDDVDSWKWANPEPAVAATWA